MEDTQKAIQMAFAVFLFIIAATTAVFLYTTLMQNTQKILSSSDNMSMSTEQAITNRIDFNRKISKGEIVMTILDMENNTSYISEIYVGESKFTKDDDINSKIKTWIDSDTNSYYNATYDSAKKRLKYTGYLEE